MKNKSILLLSVMIWLCNTGLFTLLLIELRPGSSYAYGLSLIGLFINILLSPIICNSILTHHKQQDALVVAAQIKEKTKNVGENRGQ